MNQTRRIARQAAMQVPQRDSRIDGVSLCVIWLHMKTVSLRDMQHHLSEVMRHVDQGNEVLVTRRNRPVARLSPVRPAAIIAAWPDFAGRAKRIKGAALCKTILAERE